MELEFNTTITKSRDIDLLDFDTYIDNNFDYINNIDINIKWRSVIYIKEYGIVSNWPIINGFYLDMDYQLLEDEESNKIIDEEKKYKLNLGLLDFLTAPLSTSEQRERNNLPYEEKKWVINNSYSSREDDETHLFITSVEIDFESKEINVVF